MHILIISRSYPNSINKTSGNFVKNQVEALAEHDIEIGVAGVYNASIVEYLKVKNFKKLGYYSEDNKSNVNIFGYLYPVIPKLHLLNNKIKFLIGKKLLKKYFKKFGKPDLIHLHTFEPGLLGIWAKEKYKIPYIVTEHTSSFYTGAALNWHKRLAQKTYSAGFYNIAVSSSFADDLEQRFKSKFNYFPNFVDTTQFNLIKRERKDYIRFINIAYLQENKNQKILIEAFNKAFGEDEKFQLIIVGNGEEKKNLKNLLSQLNVRNIKLYGYATQEEIKILLQNSDYFVLSSNIETFGVVIIEAMSCGLPVVSTKCGGPESIITDDKLGILCKKNNIDELSQSLIEISQNKFDSQFIRDYAIENFSYESLSRKLINIYSDIVSK